MTCAQPCNCCEPVAPLTPLLVENRPALSAIAYRIGTYASFRASMLEEIVVTRELATLTTRLDDDYTVTVVDLWAAVADVLTFYQERYANEAFLRTATRRESVSRLARLIDYGLRPGIAALAWLAFTADDGKSFRVDPGLRVQSVPGQDEQPQTFEALETVVADWRLNRRRMMPPPYGVNPLAPGSTAGARRSGAGRAGGGTRAGDRRPHRRVCHRLGGPGRGADPRRRPLRRGPDRARVARAGSGDVGPGLENREGRANLPPVRPHRARVGDGGFVGLDGAGRDQMDP